MTTTTTRTIDQATATRVLWLAVAAQAGWLLLNGLLWHRAPGLDPIGAIVGATVAAFAVLRRRWSAVAVRVLMAADFLLAVADRFGALGRPGAAGVSWGDFPHFVAYTRTVVAFLPAGFAPSLAVAATVAEVALGLALLFGVLVRLAAPAAAGLLGVYGICMSVSLPAAEQFHYNVFLLCAAMVALATVDSRWRSVRPAAR